MILLFFIKVELFCIIYCILLYFNYIPKLFHYFYCVTGIFNKYCFSFKLNHFDGLKSRVEYVGHDLTTQNNCLAELKFTLIQD